MQAAKAAKSRCSALSVQVFSDRDIDAKRQKIEAALSEADVFFGSLLFDYDQVGITKALNASNLLIECCPSTCLMRLFSLTKNQLKESTERPEDDIALSISVEALMQIVHCILSPSKLNLLAAWASNVGVNCIY